MAGAASREGLICAPRECGGGRWGGAGRRGGAGAGTVGKDGLHGEGILHGGDDAQRPPQRGQARVALLEFKDRYNRAWLCERHGHQTPAQVRAALGARGVRGVGRPGGQSEGRRGSRFDLEERGAISVCPRILVNRRPSRLP